MIVGTKDNRDGFDWHAIATFQGKFGDPIVVGMFLQKLGVTQPAELTTRPVDARKNFDPTARQLPKRLLRTGPELTSEDDVAFGCESEDRDRLSFELDLRRALDAVRTLEAPGDDRELSLVADRLAELLPRLHRSSLAPGDRTSHPRYRGVTDTCVFGG